MWHSDIQLLSKGQWNGGLPLEGRCWHLGRFDFGYSDKKHLGLGTLSLTEAEIKVLEDKVY